VCDLIRFSGQLALKISREFLGLFQIVLKCEVVGPERSSQVGNAGYIQAGRFRGRRSFFA
jgi:hypothetical protein